MILYCTHKKNNGCQNPSRPSRNVLAFNVRDDVNYCLPAYTAMAAWGPCSQRISVYRKESKLERKQWLCSLIEILRHRWGKISNKSLARERLFSDLTSDLDANRPDTRHKSQPRTSLFDGTCTRHHYQALSQTKHTTFPPNFVPSFSLLRFNFLRFSQLIFIFRWKACKIKLICSAKSIFAHKIPHKLPFCKTPNGLTKLPKVVKIKGKTPLSSD